MSGLSNSSRRSSLAIDGQQSLLNAIKNFVQAVDTMDETVMIPCRLRDIPVDNSSVAVSTSPEVNNNKAVIPTYQVNGDLYNFYAMLHAIRKEITVGPNLNDEESIENSDENMNENDPSNENARKTAAAFRYHLRGLFGLLHQMTETAKVLSSRYEKEVSSTQSGISSVSSFSL
ncbi:mid1-interacting protein 1a [Plakobranchus ocellatus]|uniref:Mid1-interacting protein 1a n=1 Tax=Plakobranchus ocellatus TaxID=259542 RepID=A0AAV4DWR8_9GAST|nr:mid1-interacting protein 1a [Plakobranchus ocellatus]